MHSWNFSERYIGRTMELHEYRIRIDMGSTEPEEKIVEATDIEICDRDVVFWNGKPINHFSTQVYAIPRKNLLDVEKQ